MIGKKSQIKIFIAMLFILLLIPGYLLFVSGATDNTKTYNETTRTITITNSSGDDIAEIKLITKINHIVFEGGHAFEIEVNNLVPYDKFFKKIDLFEKDSKTGILGSKINKDFEYKFYNETYSWTEEVVVNVTCSGNISCVEEKENITYYGGWFDFDLKVKDVQPGITKIRAYYNDLKPGETIEWIPTFFDIEIFEWADFTGATLYIENIGVFASDLTLDVNRPSHCQSFTVPSDFNIVGFSLKLRVGIPPANTFDANISTVDGSGFPNETLVEHLDYVISGLADDEYKWRNISFTPTLLSNGEVYSYCGNWNDDIIYTSVTGSNVYADGVAFWHVSGSWEEYAGGSYDMMFQVWGTAVNIAPVVDINFPLNNSQLFTSYVNFTYNVSDADSDPVNCSLFINQNEWLIDTSITQIVNQTFNVTNLSIGVYNWSVGCDDGAGGLGNSTEYNLTIDTIRPVINNQYPLNNTYSFSQFINFTYNVSESSEDTIDNCTLFLQHEGGAWEENATDESITQIINQTFNITLNSYGENITWKVGCWDNSSNQGNSTAYNFSSYVAIPTTTFVSPGNNTHDAFFTCAFINGRTDCSFSKFKTYTGTSFTYQTTTPSGNIANCSLWLQHNLGPLELNFTDTTITEGVDQTFDIDLKIDEEVSWLVECTNNVNEKANSTVNNFSLYEFYDNFINVIDFKTQLSRDIRFLDNATYMFANISTMWELNTNTREVNFTIQSPKGNMLVDNTNGTLNFSLHPYNFASVENRWFATLDPFLVNETGEWEFRIDVRNYGNQTRSVIFNKTIVDSLTITPSNRDFVAISFLNENFTQTITIFQNNTNAELDYNISAFIQSTYHNISFNYTSTSQTALSDGFIYALSTSMRISNTTEYQIIFFLNRTRESVPDGVYEGNITISRTLEGYEKDFYFNFRVALNPPAANLTFVQFGETALCTSALCDNSSNYAFGDTIKFFYNVQNTGGFDASNCNLTYSGGGLGSFSESGFSIAQGESKNITWVIDQVATTPPLGYFIGDINIRCAVNSLGHTGNAFNPPVMTLTIISSTESAIGGPGGGGGGGGLLEIIEEIIEEVPALLRGAVETVGASKLLLVVGGSLAVFLIITSIDTKKMKKKVKKFMVKNK